MENSKKQKDALNSPERQQKQKTYVKKEFFFDIYKADETDVLNWMKGYAQIKGYSCKETQRVATFSQSKISMSFPVLHFTN